MTRTSKIMVGSAALACGAYLRFSPLPVLAAYRLGRDVERMAIGPARLVPAFLIGYKIGRGDRVRTGSGLPA